MKNIKLLSLFIALMFSSTISLQAQLNLLSGLKGGTYEALANDIQKSSKQEVIVLNTTGSVYNFRQLITDGNDISVAFIQYDVLIHNEKFNPNLRKDLRVLLPLFLDEEIHLIAKKGSKIKNVSDLNGKNVAIGESGQGTSVSAAMIKDAVKGEWNDIIMNSIDAQKALEKGDIDAYFYVGGAPVASLNKLGEEANIMLVNMEIKSLDEVYSYKEIPGGTYLWQKSSVKTLAVPTILACNVKNMTEENRRQLNDLLTETKAGMPYFLKSGHVKWNDVYEKSHAINWPYYYLKPIVKVK